MITIPYIMLVGAHFKSAVGKVRENSPLSFSGCLRAGRGLQFLIISRKFIDTDLRYRASNMITIPYIMQIGAHFKSAAGEVRESIP